jgi:hypothetical protein
LCNNVFVWLAERVAVAWNEVIAYLHLTGIVALYIGMVSKRPADLPTAPMLSDGLAC